jgi:GTPase SAR1 family protein
MQEWLNDVSRYMEKDPVKLLVGNKADLTEQRQVSEDIAQRFADDNRMLFFETSAKTSTNVTAAFLLLTQNLISRATPVLDHLSLKLHETAGKSQAKCSCS